MHYQSELAENLTTIFLMVYRFMLVAMIVFKFPGYPVVYGCVSYPREFRSYYTLVDDYRQTLE